MFEQIQWLIIANPNSGSGRMGRALPAIEKTLQAAGIRYEVRRTQYEREATIIARKAIVEEGVRYIAAAGGDGTVNEVINGIFSQKEVPISEIVFTMLPVGTGNDYSRMHRLSRSLSKVADILRGGKIVQQDIGVVRLLDENGAIKEHYFANAGGLAYDAVVVQSVESNRRRWLPKKLDYFGHILKCLLAYKATPVRITFDGNEVEDRFYTINFGINKFSGAGMQMTPQAISDDGLLGFTLIKNLPRWKVPMFTPYLYLGTIGKLKRYVSLYQVQKIRVESLGVPVPIETDGELLGTTPVEIEILPKALNVLAGND